MDHSNPCLPVHAESAAHLYEFWQRVCKVGMPLQPLLSPSRDVLCQLHGFYEAVLHNMCKLALQRGKRGLEHNIVAELLGIKHLNWYLNLIAIPNRHQV